MYALNLNTDGRILSATYPKYAPGNAVIAEKLPEGNIADYRYENGVFILDPLPKPPPTPDPPSAENVTWSELAAAIQEGVDSV